MRINKKKLIIISIIITLIACLSYTIIWLINYNSYNRFIDESLTKLHYSHNSFVDRSSSTIFGVKKPAFLSFTGNLTCVSDDGTITILIWPSFMSIKTNEIGIMISDDVNKSTYMVYVDNNLNFNEKLNKEIGYSQEEAKAMRNLIDIHKNSISELFTLAKAKFNLY